ncbi:NAD(P)-dependent oxidoreductase [Pseudomonas sp. zfem002]|uniref:NAD(P)-dependent oxidoreductase n=1 Tax=Pseudomonas sp. zfem002 TaxID=3078197 RepID=UPI002929FDE2|nr:NAD(P)-dependent oxidoreductase [Pseudomonas sp. zfem002]MDU9393295.1 NAD(P)-dependent oxidoreductase [Pseudomonas sp. zfem002]
MNIAIIGASGFIGSALLGEALLRGHQVTALVRTPQRLASRPGLQAVACDVYDGAALPALLRDYDAVLVALRGQGENDTGSHYMSGFRTLLQAARTAAVKRLLVVGGGGSLEVAPGVELLDAPGFPEEYRGPAEGPRDALRLLRTETELDWTMLCPGALIEAGERTGRFRLGLDQLLVDEQGFSRISVEDFAVAMIDELERPAHSRRRFTVGY